MAKKKIDLTPLKQFVINKGEKVGIAIALLALVGLTTLGILNVGAFSSDKQGRSFADGLEQEKRAFEAKLAAGSPGHGAKIVEGPPGAWSRILSIYSQRPYWLLPEVVVNKRNTPFLAALSKDVQVDYIPGGVFRYERNFGGAKKEIGVFADGKENKDAKEPTYEYVWQMEPRRMVVVQTTFPIKAQLEEFRTAFLLENIQQVLKNPKDRPSFLGMIVHRKEMSSGKWEILYHFKPELMPKEIRDFLRESILDEDNPKAYQAAIYPGLVTPLPKLANISYPPVGIESVAKVAVMPQAPMAVKPTVEVKKDDKDKGKEARDIAMVSFDRLPKKFQAKFENFNPLDPDGQPLEQTSFKGPDLAKYAGGNKEGKGDGQKGEGGDDKPLDIKDIPDALVRFVDPTVEVNKSYQYKIEVRMRNPNFGRPEEVNYPQLAKIEELHARKGEQEVITPQITIPEEYFYLAADMQPLLNLARGADFLGARPDQVAIHIQKYFEQATGGAGQIRAIADWGICERLLHRRGDVIGYPQRQLAPAKEAPIEEVWTEIPEWDKRLKNFVVNKEQVPTTRYHLAALPKIDVLGIPLDFTLKWKPNVPRNDQIWAKSPLLGEGADPSKLWGKSPVLVDFDGGKRDKWVIAPNLSVTKDESGAELLILNPDLSLTSKSARADYESLESPDSAYRARLEAWRARVRASKGIGGNSAPPPPPIKGILGK